jgi:hypothetical protein
MHAFAPLRLCVRLFISLRLPGLSGASCCFCFSREAAPHAARRNLAPAPTIPMTDSVRAPRCVAQSPPPCPRPPARRSQRSNLRTGRAADLEDQDCATTACLPSVPLRLSPPRVLEGQGPERRGRRGERPPSRCLFFGSHVHTAPASFRIADNRPRIGSQGGSLSDVAGLAQSI